MSCTIQTTTWISKQRRGGPRVSDKFFFLRVLVTFTPVAADTAPKLWLTLLQDVELEKCAMVIKRIGGLYIQHSSMIFYTSAAEYTI